jgi:RNA polymerase sigma-32 factor
VTALSLPVPALVNAGSLEHYIQGVARFPMLSAEEEVALGRRLRDHNDLQAAQSLILSHLRLVVSIARQYHGYGLPQADLIQEGNVGLMKAVKRFDPERGVRLVTFAMHWIKAEIHEYVLRNWRLVKIATTKAQRKLFFGLRSHKPGFASLSPQETLAVAAQLGVKPEDVSEMEMRLTGQDISLEPVTEEEENHLSPIQWLADENADPVALLSEQEQEQQAHEHLTQALAALDQRSRDIVSERWLRADESALTLHQLAERYGISAERVRQIENRAMEKLRLALKAA